MRRCSRCVLAAAFAALFMPCALMLVTLAHGQSRTPIVLWHAYGEREERGLSAAISTFEREHPEYDVEVNAIPFGAYASKLEAAIPARRGPDVFIDAHDRLRSYHEARLIRPIGEQSPAPSEFDPEHLEALTLDGTLFALPVSIKTAVLFVNEDLVSGTELDSLEALEALRGSLPEDVFPLAWDADDAYQFAALLHAYGGELLDSEGRYQFVGARAEQALEHLVRLLRARVIPEETSYELVRDLFRGGRAATAISGPWFANELGTELRWSVRALPTASRAGGRAMAPFATVEAVMIAEGARELEGAQQLARFIAGRDGALVRALEGDHIVASRLAWEDPRLLQRETQLAFRRAAEQARITSTHPHMRSVFVPAERALRNALRGDVTIPDALEGGRRRFEDETRDPPPPEDPRLGLLVLGVLLFWATFVMVRRARDPMMRVALRRSLPAYPWVAHAALAILLLVILPLLVGAGTSFFAGRGRDLHYVGIGNYVEILTARGGELFGPGSFFTVLAVTVLWTLANITLHVVIGVALALLLHRPTLRLKGVYRVLLVLPWAVPSYVTALAWRGMFHRQFGAVNAMLELLGAEPISFFARWSTAFAANVTTNMWLGFPFMMVVTLGALTQIPRDLYEAAEVDGASRWQQFRHVTLPLLVPSLAPAVAMGAVWTFNMFNVVYLVSAGEPDGTTEILVSEAYRWAFTRGHQYGYAAAYAVLIFLLLYWGTRALSRIRAPEAAR